MKKQKEKCECDYCFKVVENLNVYETSEGDYICQDCMETQNDRYETLRDEQREEVFEVCN